MPRVAAGQSVATAEISFAKPRAIKARFRGPRQDTVLFLSYREEQKLRFQGVEPLRCASRLLPPGSRKVAGPVGQPQAASYSSGCSPTACSEATFPELLSDSRSAT